MITNLSFDYFRDPILKNFRGHAPDPRSGCGHSRPPIWFFLATALAEVVFLTQFNVKIRKDGGWIYRANDVCSSIINAENHCCYAQLPGTLTERSISSKIDKLYNQLWELRETIHQIYLNFSVNVPTTGLCWPSLKKSLPTL